MYYFAYGSNMLTARLAQRVPQLAPAAADDGVYGVLYELDAGRLQRLHAAEGPAYEFVELNVVSDRLGTVPAAVYRGHAAWLDTGLVPFKWYLRFVLAGAREHGL